MFWTNVGEGILANSLFTALLIVGGWILYAAFRRRRLVKFFGLGPSRRLLIYTSTLWIPAGTAFGVDNVARSFMGSAVPSNEATVAAELQSIFSSGSPGIRGLTGWLENIRLVDVRAEVLASPQKANDVARSEPFITIGSPAYNAASKRLQDDLPARGRFSNDPNFSRLEIDGHEPIWDLSHSLLQRVRDPKTGQMAFGAAGRSEGATMGAVKYLTANWRTLARRYRSDVDFCLVLRVNDDGSKQDVVYQIP